MASSWCLSNEAICFLLNVNCQQKKFLKFRTFCATKDLAAGAVVIRDRPLNASLRKICHFMTPHWQVMLKNGLLFLLTDRLIRKLYLLNLFYVSHAAKRTLHFLFACILDDVVAMLGITISTLSKTSLVVLNDDVSVFFEEALAKMADNNVLLAHL